MCFHAVLVLTSTAHIIPYGGVPKRTNMRSADQLVNQRSYSAFHNSNSQCVFQMPNKKEKRKRLKEGYDQYDENIPKNNNESKK